MADENIGRAVLALQSDLKQFLSDLDKAESRIKSMSATTRESGKEVERTALSFGQMTKAVALGEAAYHGVVAAGRKVISFLGECVDEASKADTVWARLTAAMKTQGTYTPQAIEQYRALGQSTQHLTTYSHDLAEESMALMIQIGNIQPRDMGRALKASEDLAAGLGIGLVEASEKVAKATMGNTRELGRLIPELRNMEKGTASASKVLDILNRSGFSGQAAAQVQTYGGRVAQLGNAVDDFKESLGFAITHNETLLSLARQMTGAILDQSSALGDRARGMNLVSDSVIGLVRGTALLARGFDWVQTGFYAVGTGVQIIVQQIATAIGRILEEQAKGAVVARALADLVPGGGAIAEGFGLTKAIVLLGGAARDSYNYATLLGQEIEQNQKRSGAWGQTLQDIATRADALAAQLDKTRGKVVESAGGVSGVRPPTVGSDVNAKSIADLSKKLAQLGGQYNAAIAADADMFAFMQDHAPEILKYGQEWIAYGQKVSGAFKWAFVTAQEYSVDKVFREARDKSAAYVDDLMKEAAKVGEAHQEAAKSTLDTGAKAWSSALELYDQRTMTSLDVSLAAIQREADAKRAALDEHSSFYALAMDGIEAETREKMHAAEQAYVEAINGMERSTGGLLKSFVDVLSQFPRMLQSAFQGGGGFKGAGQSLLAGLGALGGERLMLSTIAQPITSALVGSLGATMATTIGGVLIPGIGAAAGALLPKLFSMFGPSKEYRETVTKRSEFEQSLGGVDAMIAKVSKAYAVLGKSGAEADAALKALWSAKDLNAYNAALNTIQTSLALAEAQAAATDAALQKYGVTWEDLDDAGRKSHLSDWAKQLVKDQALIEKAGVSASTALKKQAGEYNDLLAAAIRTGQKIPASVAPVLKDLERMGLLTEANRKALLGLTSSSAVDFESMQAAAEKYGIGLSDLGPAFQQAKLDDAARIILADFKLLTDNGADVNGVLAGMSDEISTVVNDSIKFGTTIPENMRPLIETLITNGQLLDENGEKITDLSKIKFAEPIEEGFDRVVEAIDRLTEVLTTGLPGAAAEGAAGVNAALDSIRDRKVGIEFVVTGSAIPRPAGEQPGIVPEEYHAGGIVMPARAMPRFHDGGEIPAWLLPGEGVLSHVGMTTIGGPSALAAANRGELPGRNSGNLAETIAQALIRAGVNRGGTLNATFIGAIKERYYREELIPGILAILRKGGGTLTDWRTVLGVQ